MKEPGRGWRGDLLDRHLPVRNGVVYGSLAVYRTYGTTGSDEVATKSTLVNSDFHLLLAKEDEAFEMLFTGQLHCHPTSHERCTFPDVEAFQAVRGKRHFASASPPATLRNSEASAVNSPYTRFPQRRNCSPTISVTLSLNRVKSCNACARL